MEIRDYEYVLLPNILKNYKCSSSGECCQSKWRIDIDKKSYDITKEKLEEVKEDISTYISKNDKGAYFSKFSKGYCKFITDEKLCRIHRDFGWECLSDTCKTYPRYLKLTSRGMELGVTFSCPSAAKLLLTNEKIEIIKVKKEELFFMKPHNVSFIIPENNLENNIAFRYYEVEETMLKILTKDGSVGKKLDYITTFLREIERKDARTINFEKIIKDYAKFTLVKEDKIKLETILEHVLLTKKANLGNVTSELLSMFKIVKLDKVDLVKNREFLRKGDYYLTNDDINEMKKTWKPKYEKILNNYMTCILFNKDAYYNSEYAVFKAVILGSLLKIRFLLNLAFLKRELTDEEILNTIKFHENDFSHDSDFFKELYKKSDLGMTIHELTLKLATVLY